MKTNKEIEKEIQNLLTKRDSGMYGYYSSVFMEDFEGGYPIEWNTEFIEQMLSQRKEDIEAIVELIEKMHLIPVSVPHGSPYLSGYNEALEHVISSLKEKLIVENH